MKNCSLWTFQVWNCDSLCTSCNNTLSFGGFVNLVVFTFQKKGNFSDERRISPHTLTDELQYQACSQCLQIRQDVSQDGISISSQSFAASFFKGVFRVSASGLELKVYSTGPVSLQEEPAFVEQEDINDNGQTQFSRIASE